MSSRTGWIAGAMVVAAIALVMLVRPAPPADSSAAAPPTPETAAVPDEPRRRVDAEEEVTARELPTREPLPQPARAAAPSEVVEPNREAAPPIPAPPDWAANFAAESIDREWAPGAETQIVSRFGEQPGLQLLAIQVQCRTTMCEVQMTRPGSSTRDPPMDLLKTSGMQLLSVNTTGNQPGMHTTVAILSRPGHEPFPIRQQAADPPGQR